MKGLLTCNSCSTQSSSGLTVVYNTLNESQFLFFFPIIFLEVISSYLSCDNSESEVLAAAFQSVQIVWFPPKQNCILIGKSATFGNDRGAELMQSGSQFCLKFLENALHYCLVLLSAQSFNQLSPSVCKVACGTKQDTVDEHKNRGKKNKNGGGRKGLNTIRWQTCPLMRNGSLELASTTDEVHMVFWGLELCSPKSTRHEWWAQLAALHIFKRLNRHHFNCKQLIFKWSFHTFTGVFRI